MKSTFYILFILLSSSWSMASLSLPKDFFTIESSENQGSMGKIYLIGTYHEDNNSSCDSMDIDAVNCRKGYVEFINQNSFVHDIVLFEGRPASAEQFKPGRSIIKITNEGQQEHASFNKDLYIIGWEDALTLLVASLAEYIKEGLKKAPASLSMNLARLRAEYFYNYVVLYKRNRALFHILSDAVKRASPNKNVFVLLGGGHLKDPYLMDGLRSLGRDYSVIQHKKSDVNVHQLTVKLRQDLQFLGINVQKMEGIYSEIVEVATRQKGLSQEDIDHFKNKILFADSPDCNGPLSK